MKLIDKAVVVAEIERIKKEECPIDTYEGRNKLFYFERFLSFLNTLEVKEVDLEKYLKEDVEDVFFDLNGVAVKGATHYLTVEDVKDIAKHFFELGLKASNPLTWEDIKTLQDKSREVYAEVAKWKDDFYSIYPTEQSFLEEVLKRFKAQKRGSVWDYKK